MDVFATKDGRIYSVSLETFTVATGKKAPYYKRVKESGKYIEKAYAICPGCGNPVHFVNLFNTKKKKKAYVRHHRSNIRRLAKYSASAYRECPYVAGAAPDSLERWGLNGEAEAFCRVIVDAFGITQENAKLLAAIYYKLINENQETANQVFCAMIASACYYDCSFEDFKKEPNVPTAKKLLQEVAWGSVARLEYAKTAIDDICALGFRREDVETLFGEITEQHNELAYAGKTDFAHLCATMATILNNDRVIKPLGEPLAEGTTGVASTDANAGYIGDVCGTAGAEPSMNSGDYKADLDAVNLSARVKKSSNISFLKIVGTYYDDMASGSVNRAEEFETNISMETLRNQRESFYSTLKKRIVLSSGMTGKFLGLDNPLTKEQLEKGILVFDKFIECIEQSAEEWPDD